MPEFKVFDFTADHIPKIEDTYWFFQDEWENQRELCEAFSGSRQNKNITKIGARECRVEEISPDEAKEFLNQHHLQGNSRRSQIRFGLRTKDKQLVGLVSLAPHHRQNHDKVIVLDRVSFRSGITVSGGLSRLIGYCVAWCKSNDIDMLLTFSENRLTDGLVYGKVGFVFDGNLRSDYFYVKDGKRYSKQSQKKGSSNCPADMTELEWATARGLRRIYDLGKKRWVYKINAEALTKRERQSLVCAEQHSSGLFKRNKIRGDIEWRNKSVYFGSSFELRFLFETEGDPSVIDVKRADCFWIDGRARNPDFVVTYEDRVEVVEIKPATRVEEFADQIKDSMDYARRSGYSFRVWTERDSLSGNERAVIKWAREYLAEKGVNRFLLEKVQRDRQKARKHYWLRLSERMEVSCTFCDKVHEIRKDQYKANIEANGRYICIVENGHLIGKRSKEYRKNPYAAEGKKKCNGECKKVLPYAEFGVDKSRSDGYGSRCKVCRAKENKQKYHDSKKKEGA